MYPASDTRQRIDQFLARAEKAGVRVQLLKLSNREAWQMRGKITFYHAAPFTPAWQSYRGTPLKIGGPDRWSSV